MTTEKTHDLILQLKQIRIDRELSFNEIVDMVEASGGSISLSTVRRIFAPGSEDKGFRYDNSIKPLVVALLMNQEPEEIAPDVDSAQSEIAALKTVIEIKEQIQQQTSAELAYLKGDSQRKNEQISALTAQVRRKDRAIFWLSFVLIGLLLIIVAALVIDKINPDVGYFWRTMAAHQGDISGLTTQMYTEAFDYYAVL